MSVRLLLTLCLVAPIPLLQGQTSTGEIDVSVTDSSEAVIVGASVTISGLTGGQTYALELIDTATGQHWSSDPSKDGTTTAVSSTESATDVIVVWLTLPHPFAKYERSNRRSLPAAGRRAVCGEERMPTTSFVEKLHIFFGRLSNRCSSSNGTVLSCPWGQKIPGYSGIGRMVVLVGNRLRDMFEVKFMEVNVSFT